MDAVIAIIAVGGGLVGGGGGGGVGVIGDGLGGPAKQVVIGLVHEGLGMGDGVDVNMSFRRKLKSPMPNHRAALRYCKLFNSETIKFGHVVSNILW